MNKPNLLKKVNKNPLFVKNGKDYYPFWESKTGKTIIQIENPSASDKTIFEDGKWNTNANLVGLTNQEKGVYWDTTKQSISNAYNASPQFKGGQAEEECNFTTVGITWCQSQSNTINTRSTSLGAGQGPGVSGTNNLVMVYQTLLNL